MLVKVISILIAHTYTSDDLIERIGFLRDYFGAKLFGGKDALSLDAVLPAEVDAHTRVVMRNLVAEFEKSELTAESVYQVLPDIEREVSRLPGVTLYVPVRFPSKQREEFGIWFRRHVQPNLVLTMRVDTRVAGGCAVVWNNVYHDFSLRYHMRAHRAELVAMFDRHTTPYAA